MVNQKSSTNKVNSVGGIKMLIVASSVAITLGGWGMLAADQLQTGAITQTTVAQSSSASTQQRFNQLAASQVSAAPRAVTRTRSSR